MGFGLWVDANQCSAWAQGTHEYRPMGAAVISITDQFRLRDFNRRLRRPGRLSNSFVGFFGSLEEVNCYLRARRRQTLRRTPFHVR